MAKSDMPTILQSANFERKQFFRRLREERARALLHNASMPKTRDIADTEAGNHLRAWREFRHMTQAQLAEAVNTTASVISLLEAGGRQLSPKWLRRLAPVLNTTPGHLLEHDPNNLPTDMLDIWADIAEADRPRVLKAIEAFRQRKTA